MAKRRLSAPAVCNGRPRYAMAMDGRMRAPASMPGQMVFVLCPPGCIFVTQRLKKRGGATPHPPPLGLAAVGLLSPEVDWGEIPVAHHLKLSQLHSNLPSPVRPPAVPLLAAALPGPVRSSECSACTTLSGSCAPVPLAIDRPRRSRRFQGRLLVTRPPPSRALSTSTRSCAGSRCNRSIHAHYSPIGPLLSASSPPRRRPCGYALRARPV